MLDLKQIRQNPQNFKTQLGRRGVESKIIDDLLEADRQWREISAKSETLKAEQNRVSKKMPELSGAEKEKVLAQMQQISSERKSLETQLEKVSLTRDRLLFSLPNVPHADCPDGADDSENVEIERWGEIPKFDFPVRDHVEIGELTGTIDFESARRISGARFAFLKGRGAELEWALQRFAIEKLKQKGFIPVIPPMMIRAQTLFNAGKEPGTIDKALQSPEKFNLPADDLSLIGTAEHVICSLHAGQTLEKLPIRYCGWSECFRREAGAAGKDTRGLIRLHQFEKCEMFIFADAANSEKEHKLLIEIQKEIWRDLGISFRVIAACTGDIAWSDARMFDLEAWIPSQNDFREVTSGSNCTDFQSRRMRTRDESGELVHTLNATAIAIQRAIVAIFENYQNADGSVRIPEVLVPFCGFDLIGVEGGKG